jgi:hypothetical protein
MKFLPAFLILLLPTFIAAKGVAPYEWEKNRARYNLSTKEKEKSEYILKHHIQYEYEIEEKQFVMYSTLHRIVLVNSNEAIQKHNRIFIHMNSTIELVELKARSINKEGKVIYFDKNNLKEVKEEEGNKAYRIFAMEGVELGSEVEYYYTKKMFASLFDRVFTQSDVPVKSSSFLLTCPPHLKFDFKSYQGYPEIKKEESEKQNVYTGSMNDIIGLKEEPFSHFDPNRKRIEFKLAYNTARSTARMYTWDEAAKNFYSRLTTLAKDEEKGLEKFYKTLNDVSSDKVDSRIRNIEKKIKTTIQLDKEGRSEGLNEINAMTKYKLASREGLTRLFLAVFAKANIPTHVVITCNREDVKFDGTFDSWGYLDDYLLFFPDTKAFISPYTFETRYPFIPHHFTAQRGLFIEPFTMGGVKSGLASVQDIPALDYSHNFDNLSIEVKFSADLSSNEIKQYREFAGYNAMYLTPFYDLMSKDDQKKMVENLTKGSAPDANIKTWTASPVAKSNNENFAVDVSFTSTHFLEKAGPRLLFKVGELIGAQTEMYRDEERLTDVENDFNRLYDRTIKIELPSGYTLKNPDDLKIDVRFKDKDRIPFAFISNYTLKDNILEVKISEYYQDIYVPVTRYEDFRKVINAAADFNKITLVLEKKK